MIAYLRARLLERSTYAGIGAALTGALTTVGSYLPASDTRILAGIAVTCGVLMVLLLEQPKKDGGHV